MRLRLAFLIFLSFFSSLASAADTERAPSGAATTQTITLGGGCFWCLEAVFTELKGVQSVTSGYSGGRVPNPTYTQVSGGRTGHAEVVQIAFDPAVVSLDTILRAFFTIHDPTTLNRQGADVGEQYRSVAFYRDDAQKAAGDFVSQAIKLAG